ncbi:hypothetical protein BVC80_8851g22 [Macleaya cordata]|uniref:Uncharacterized protein n=1 Tax=Macleaya cordata TaxID=56857 RepID=A0A200PY60_MACCD|nr:hypothetical protein BVC80_8851g22 [Macleaya cordata]
MEKSEPTFVPEWLKGTGSISGGGSTSHHSASHSDDHAVTLPSRNRSSFSIGDYDSPRSSAYMDRTSSSYFRRSSSSNGSMGHGKDPSAYSRSYSSFARSHRDKDWDKDLLDFHDRERSVLGDHRNRDYSDSLGVSANALTSRIEKDTLRRSQSMISGKGGEVWPKKVAAVSSSSKNNSHNTNNGVNVGGTAINHIHKATFERDFPSLGAEERQGVPEIGRVSSPGLGTTVQSLTMGTSAVLGDGWTSALVEVPAMIGSNNMVLASAQQASPVSLTTSAPSTTTGRNMAETLAQAPSRARTAPQLSVETQRLEELAIKQSRQLIPVTPSMPKALVLNSEKQKPKAAGRSGEMTMANKIGQQQLASSHHVSPQLQGGPARSDVAKTSPGGKLLVLKAAREKNGISPATKDGSSPTNVSRVAANNPITVAPSAPLTNPNNPKLSSAQRKVSPLPSTLASSIEKRPTMSQAQSRNDFFNLMRMKTSANLSSAAPDPNLVVSSTSPKKSDEPITEIGTTPVSPQGSDAPLTDLNGLDWSAENGGDMGNIGNACQEESQGYPDNGDDEHSSPDAIVYPDEEEAEFLRSLGWDENAEGGGLTPEEINGFFQSVQCMDLRPSLKLCRGSQQLKLQLLLDPHVGGASSGLSSRDSKSEA